MWSGPRVRTPRPCYTLPVVDGGRRLIGVVEMRELVLSHPATLLTELVVTEPVFVRATDAAEKAARLMRETNLINLPVVDSEDRLVGLLTIDDAVEVIEAADSEDVARQAGASPWAGHYMAAGVFQLARYRAMWLLLLLVAATLTVSVTDAFETTLAQAANLALFIPLLIGAGGNAGAQAATSCVRALAVGEVRVSDLLEVIWRECRVGLVLGSMLRGGRHGHRRGIRGCGDRPGRGHHSGDHLRLGGDHRRHDAAAGQETAHRSGGHLRAHGDDDGRRDRSDHLLHHREARAGYLSSLRRVRDAVRHGGVGRHRRADRCPAVPSHRVQCEVGREQVSNGFLLVASQTPGR